jgi:hypothetical protein
MAAARRLYVFCPDLVEPGVETLAKLAERLATQRRLCLWWD